MKKIIICDDDKEIVEAISEYLSAEGYKMFPCYNGKDAINTLKKNHVDLILMDIMMPGEDGIKTVIKIKEEYQTPVIFISAKSEDDDKILGLNIGADDYITKPFNPLELKARVKALLKRVGMANEKKEKLIYKNGDLKLNHSLKSATYKNEDLHLTSIEYKILLFFMKNIGKVLSSNDIYKEVWEQDEAFNVENTIAVHIRHLRQKIEKNATSPKFIKVVWGIGYKMVAV